MLMFAMIQAFTGSLLTLNRRKFTLTFVYIATKLNRLEAKQLKIYLIFFLFCSQWSCVDDAMMDHVSCRMKNNCKFNETNKEMKSLSFFFNNIFIWLTQYILLKIETCILWNKQNIYLFLCVKQNQISVPILGWVNIWLTIYFNNNQWQRFGLMEKSSSFVCVFC